VRPMGGLFGPWRTVRRKRTDHLHIVLFI